MFLSCRRSRHRLTAFCTSCLSLISASRSQLTLRADSASFARPHAFSESRVRSLLDTKRLILILPLLQSDMTNQRQGDLSLPMYADWVIEPGPPNHFHGSCFISTPASW